jgi:hypothetical protein
MGSSSPVEEPAVDAPATGISDPVGWEKLDVSAFNAASAPDPPGDSVTELLASLSSSAGPSRRLGPWDLPSSSAGPFHCLDPWDLPSSSFSSPWSL